MEKLLALLIILKFRAEEDMIHVTNTKYVLGFRTTIAVFILLLAMAEWR